MTDSRTMTNIARESQVAERNMQHFMSNSPWSGQALVEQVQQSIVARRELYGGILMLDESAHEKSGDSSAGAGRQHNGRMGKIDESQVGVYLAYANEQHWTLWDGCLFIPEKWFSAGATSRRAKAGIPDERVFQTKVELGWQMIERAKATGLSFEAVAFDSLYGRSHWLRTCCENAALEYYADIPNNYPLYRDVPMLEFEQGKRGKPTQKLTVVGQAALKASDFARLAQTAWETITLRPTEHGQLQVEFARYPVWTVNPIGTVREETLLLKRERPTIRYTLTNASHATPLATLAARKCQRYFVDRSLQDAKSELGLADIPLPTLLFVRVAGEACALNFLAASLIQLFISRPGASQPQIDNNEAWARIIPGTMWRAQEAFDAVPSAAPHHVPVAAVRPLRIVLRTADIVCLIV